MKRPSKWSPLRILIFIFLKCGTMEPILAMEDTFFSRLVVAASHTALSGDLAVLIINLSALDHMKTTTSTTTQIPEISTVGKTTARTRTKFTTTTTTEEADIVMEQEEEDDNDDYDSWQPQPEYDPFVLRVMRLDGFSSELIGEVPIETSTSVANITLSIPCGFFSRGGAYSLQLQRKSVPASDKFMDTSGVQMRTTLDVRWPTPSLTLEPQHFNTYPDQPVLATLEYTGISCAPAKGIPEDTYSLQLVYCGASVLSCDPRNKTNIQMLYSEEIAGFPSQKILKLRCEFFGLAGHYALRLKPSDVNSTAPTTSAYIKVEVSNQYVFNVHARSVYPCDGNSGGLSVLFEYPSCRLQDDRVRVYGRLRADVASLAPPSTLHYVAELKAPPGKHTLTFDCEIFTEKFVEYCFVYVSQAINGAMAEVRVDCIPTFPIQDSDAGGWGDWSPWGPCSSTCVGGVRNRFRFCDKPPPRYGAKFCQGKAVESEACGGAGGLNLENTWSAAEWECKHGQGLAAERPEVTAEVGTKCRCGCVVNLRNETITRKILAASTQACPGRSFWLIQTEPGSVVKLHFDQTKFPCSGQYVRARDGDSLSAELLADVAIDKNTPESGTVMSTAQSLLLEFFSDEITVARASCSGGFLAHVSIFAKSQPENVTEDTTAVLIGPKVMAAAGRWALWFSPAHLAAASLLLLMFLVSIFLALQYAVKYRKYQVAEDLDSLTDNSTCSGSMQGLARRARALSSATLISEVVSLVRLTRRRPSGHGRLEETSGDLEDGYESTETQADMEGEEEANNAETGTLKLKEQEDINGSQKTIVASVKSTPSRRSSSSSTLTSISGQPEVKYARPVKLRTVGPISPVSEEASISEDSRRCSTESGSTSVNNVSVSHPKPTRVQAKGFSPASTSSNISTLRCGKETKDRRNRERLLQGPGSEFSLANPETDLELDYYDYNVVNAGAAPGSYLGMDPAFLVWIPPLTPGETEILEAIEEDHHYEEIPDRREKESRFMDTEGAALTPAEYQRARMLRQDQKDLDTEILARKYDPGESRLHDEIIMEYRARLHEGMLPIHRILEESRVRVSEESLAKHSHDDTPHIDIIPNRLVNETDKRVSRDTAASGSHVDSSGNSLSYSGGKFTPKANRDRLIEEQERSRSASIPRNNRLSSDDDKRRTPASVRSRLQEYIESSANQCKYNQLSTETTRSCGELSKEQRKKKLEVNQSLIVKDNKKSLNKLNDYRDVGRNEESKDEFILPKPKTPIIGSRKYKDVADLNLVMESSKEKILTHVESIPMKEFSRTRNDSPARVHKSKETDNDINNIVLVGKKQCQIQSPDYGVEMDIRDEISRDSIYDLIGEDEEEFKFADDDEDEYIDNKITA
ncbi:Similar to Adamts1: A disintegrin and metalloproteinase with thrombospondin motifs 1 (Rattus norvegicus) [Cotesia congregata]|uniref:Similar to Adamts1: A disintegrin and metalloproteinase with thrombospondin motifs 1 (Rattus norvegicus) n=1 Tax=Cotesia congregata TaxID=51543 RepID=A0A8J2HGX7_COTCN|nr:Similar to Adamts1: A disintegrin and metalloproteinase with thrombospondin motifs 1 (Rattus norvegicus) [Cotesia congregata]